MNFPIDTSKYSHIGRDLSWHLPTHRRILLFAVATTIIVGGQQLLIGTDFVQAVIHAVGAGGFSFGTWALGREIDPDHDLSAFIGAILTTLLLLFMPLPWVFPVGVLVVLLRVVNWTFGKPALPTDYLTVLISAAIAIGLDNLWPLGIVVTIGFALNGILPRPQRPLAFVFAAAMLGLSLLISLLTPRTTPTSSPELLHFVLAGGAIAVFGLVMLRQKAFSAVGDTTGEALIPARIQAGRALTLLSALALFIFYGGVGFIALLPAWTAMLGVGLRMLLRRG